MTDKFYKVLFNEGQTYKNRRNEDITILRNNLSGDFPILGVNPKCILLKYTNKGRRISDDFKSEDDLLL